MENTLRIEDSNQIAYIFDLKGSMVDRFTKNVTKRSDVLKDINFLQI